MYYIIIVIHYIIPFKFFKNSFYCGQKIIKNDTTNLYLPSTFKDTLSDSTDISSDVPQMYFLY